jgi:hypothetical protein
MIETLTLGQARSLTAGKTIYSIDERNSDGSAQRFKVLSVKTWKRDTSKVLVSLKRGLKEFVKIDEDQLRYFSLEEPEPLEKPLRRV